jgi:LemA protein
MRQMEGLLIGLVAVALLALVVCAVIYNGFVSRRNAVRNAFASIDVQLKKRWDLIPNLVETVKAYASHEKETFDRVIKARQRVESSPVGTRVRFESEQDLGAGVSRLMMLAEAYPELKAGDQFLNLQRNLKEIESQLGAARRAYNASVTDWNEGVEMFPGSVFAKVFGFATADWFETPSDQRKAHDVRF